MTISPRRHEARLLWASRPSLALLLHGARFAPPIVRVPRLGWVVRDPVLCREILNSHRYFTLVGEGGVGHLWAQVLGDYVTELFDGATCGCGRRRATCSPRGPRPTWSPRRSTARSTR